MFRPLEGISGNMGLERKIRLDSCRAHISYWKNLFRIVYRTYDPIVKKLIFWKLSFKNEHFGAWKWIFTNLKIRSLTKTWISKRNFEESYLCEFLRYGLRKKCVRKPWIHTFWKTTYWVLQNILRATSKGIVLK